METSTRVVKDRQGEKAALLRDLLNCMERERQSLITVNVADLWTIMEEKNSILEAIQALGPLHHESTDPPGVRGNAKGPENLQASASSQEVDRLKEEIRSRARENAEFVHSSLAVFDELISRLAGMAGGEEAYGPHGSARRAPRRPMYRREV